MKELTDLGDLITTLESKSKEEWSILENEGKKYSALVGDYTVVLAPEEREKRTFKAISPDDFKVVDIDISLPPKYCVEVRKGDAILHNFEVKPFASGSEEAYRKIDFLFKNIVSGKES